MVLLYIAWNIYQKISIGFRIKFKYEKYFYAKEFGDDDYVLFDCPGQIELFTHLNLMNELTHKLINEGFALLSVYLIDVTFLSCERKFISGN